MGNLVLLLLGVDYLRKRAFRAGRRRLVAPGCRRGGVHRRAGRVLYFPGRLCRADRDRRAGDAGHRQVRRRRPARAALCEGPVCADGRRAGPGGRPTRAFRVVYDLRPVVPGRWADAVHRRLRGALRALALCSPRAWPRSCWPSSSFSPIPRTTWAPCRIAWACSWPSPASLLVLARRVRTLGPIPGWSSTHGRTSCRPRPLARRRLCSTARRWNRSVP